jgi:two-component system, cell cycle sensor histidine kinase and response regulator CckA
LSVDRRYLELIIRDTGIGMDEETKDRIFDPFFTTKGVGEGTGLGLFVVQSIIDKYEGAITVDSEIGVGSIFKVYLPLIDEITDSSHNTSEESSISFNKRILLVDDNEDIIKVLKVGLRHMGYEVTSEIDCIKALELVKSKPEDFDLVITDFRMPNLKGSELAAKIKEINKAVKVILITGYMDESLEELNDSDTIDACISKPVEITKLSETINNLLAE